MAFTLLKLCVLSNVCVCVCVGVCLHAQGKVVLHFSKMSTHTTDVIYSRVDT